MTKENEMITVFIASTNEHRSVADALREKLDVSGILVKPWWDAFSPGKTILEELARISKECNFAAFIFAPADFTHSKSRTEPSLRDNIIFEFGLFQGTLGRSRCFAVCPKGQLIKQISDLEGLIKIEYDPEKFKQDPRSAMATPAQSILRQINTASVNKSKKNDKDLSLSGLIEQAREVLQESSKNDDSHDSLQEFISQLLPEAPWPHGKYESKWDWIRNVTQRQIIRQDTDINRLYAIDHLDPFVWVYTETYYYFFLQARQYLKKNYDIESEEWKIRFSKPLFDAVNSALIRIQGFLPEIDGQGSSFTAFDDGDKPFLEQSEKPELEIARILIWRPNTLLAPYADTTIRMHSAFNIPLFYLPPSVLKQSFPSEYLVCCAKEQTEDTPKDEFSALVWRKGAGGTTYPINQLEIHPLKHFHSLLLNQSLLFAIDAQQLIKIGKWEEFESSVGANNDKQQ